MPALIFSMSLRPLMLLAMAVLPQIAQAQIGIMPLGDSITYGGGVGNDGTAGNGYYYQSGYRSQLYTDLKAANLSFQLQGLQTGHATQVLANANQDYSNGYGSYTL
jgi:hypothetical protein